MHVVDTETGADWCSVQSTDLNGNLGMLKGKIANRQAKQGIGTINFILTGEKMPE